jgi:dTDP-4-dehydrorhamnose 3,5-epimerase
MLFEPLPVCDAVLVRLERHADHRGFFARTFCAEEFAAHGLAPQSLQSSVSYNERAGTMRGMHFQWPPSRESKLVRCIRGRLFDVLLDLRPRSPSYLKHVSVTLDEDNRDAVFIPHGVAHGFQTLAARTEVLYQMSDVFAPQLATGVRWNDPAFDIRWPIQADVVIAERDAQYADFDRARFEAELAHRTAGSPAAVSATG